MTRTRLISLALLGSAGLLAGAWTFQILGYAPCKLCLWQRDPHYAAVLIGLLALAVTPRLLTIVGATATLTAALLGAYHTGVERGWWQGPSSCTGGGGLDLSAGLLPSDAAVNIVMCDEVSWSLLGLSMASWNVLASLALTGIWIAAFLSRK